VCCCALLLTQLSRSSFSFSFDTVTCILRQHPLTSFRNYNIAAFNQQLEYILTL
jgi:hypothetical protein